MNLLERGGMPHTSSQPSGKGAANSSVCQGVFAFYTLMQNLN